MPGHTSREDWESSWSPSVDGTGAASGSLRTHADDGRPGAVGQARSTDEVSEQRLATCRGGDGGKGSDQREPEPANRAPGAARDGARSALERVRGVAERDNQARFTTPLHHVYNGEHLNAAYYAPKRDAAAGVDGETWGRYGEALEAHIADLSGRLKGGAYRARPVKASRAPRAGRARYGAADAEGALGARRRHRGCFDAIDHAWLVSLSSIGFRTGASCG